MILSKCCKEDVQVQESCGGAYYACDKCHRPCDTYFPLIGIDNPHFKLNNDLIICGV